MVRMDCYQLSVIIMKVTSSWVVFLGCFFNSCLLLSNQKLEHEQCEVELMYVNCLDNRQQISRNP